MANDLPTLSKPARQALAANGITHVAKHTEAELLTLHGVGPASLPQLRAALKAAGLSFKKYTTSQTRTSSSCARVR